MIDLPDNDRADGEQLFRWREALGALVRRRLLLAVIVVGGSLTAVTFALLRGPAYEASAKLAVVSERARIVLSPDPRAGASVDRLNEQDLHTEVALLNSRTLIREVLAEQPQPVDSEPSSGLQRLWETVRYAPGELYRSLHDVEAPNVLDLSVREVAERLSIAPIKGSNLIEITFRDDDPVAAAAFVNELAANHVDRRVRYNQRSRTRDFFERQRELLGEKQHRAEEALQSFYEREGVDHVPGGAPALHERMSKLQTALADARRELTEYTARAQYLEDELRNLPSSVKSGAAISPSAQKIRSHLVELSLKRNALLSKYAPTSSRIAEIDRQIASAKRLLETEKRVGTADPSANPARNTLEVELARVQARLVGLKARVPALEAQIEDGRPLLERLERIGPEQERLAGEVSAAKEALQTYRRKEEEARFADALDESRIVNVAIVEPATVPHTPEFGGRMRVVLVGAVFSLFLGIVIALIRDRFDPTVKSEEELFEATSLPVLARIPN